MMSDFHKGLSYQSVSVKLATVENLNSDKLTMKLHVCFYKTLIECKYDAKALNLIMRLSRKHEVVAKAWIMHKVVAKAYML